jgi:predicted nucleic acid-binding protein
VPVVVADAGPLHYLLLVGHVDLLSALFGAVTVPMAVRAELLHPNAPEPVRRWTAAPPSWLTVLPAPSHDDPALRRLHQGESEAITLGLSLQADLVLMDDRAGVAVARGKGLNVVGTVGVLDLAARQQLIDITAVVAKLKATNFRYRRKLLDDLVAQHRSKEGGA